MEQNPQKSWKQLLTIGFVALVVPGGFIALGAYGITKLYKKYKKQDVPTEGLEKRPISDS